MSRKADPVLLRTGLNRLWKVNASDGQNPSNYQYLMQRFDKGLNSINAMLIEFDLFTIRTSHKTILQASVFKFAPTRFKDRFRSSLYLASINEIYYYIMWRRWYRMNNLNSVVKKAIPNYLSLFLYYSNWNKFINKYTQKKLFYQTVLFRYYLQKYYFHNTTGFILDPLEAFHNNNEYKDHPIVFLLEKADKKNKKSLNNQNKDIKWTENLSRLIRLCFHYGRTDFTSILAKFLAKELEKDKRHWPLLRSLKKALKFVERDINISAIKIKFIGKLRGARRSRIHLIKLKWPTMPFLPLKNKILISQSTAHTVYGSIGIKIMLLKN